MPKGINPQLSAEVQRVLKDNGDGFRPLTIAKASQISNVSMTMLNNMAAGRRVGCEGVIRFASAFGEDVAMWLDLCGYDDIAELYRSKDKQIVRVENEFDKMLNSLPVQSRPKARAAAINAVQSVILPIFTEFAA